MASGDGRVSTKPEEIGGSTVIISALRERKEEFSGENRNRTYVATMLSSRPVFIIRGGLASYNDTPGVLNISKIAFPGNSRRIMPRPCSSPLLHPLHFAAIIETKITGTSDLTSISRITLITPAKNARGRAITAEHRFPFSKTRDGSGTTAARRSRGKSEIILRRVRVARCLFPESKRA